MASYWVSAAAQVRALAKAVSAAFAASALTDEEKSPGKIEITDLPWQAPPLITSHMLAGAALQDFLDVPIELDQHRLHTFWVKTLEDMWHRPSTLMRRGALANCGLAMPRVKVGQRAFRFAQPVGWPVCDEMAGVMFSLEVAHAARVSLPVKDVVSDDDSYYVEFADGMRIGVLNGVPATNTSWFASSSARGQILDLLTMPRGDASYRCEFDQLASLRSVLHMHRARFPHNFEALDLALQALRLLTLGSYCPELLHEMRVAPVDLALAREKERALSDAIDVANSGIPDRAKLQTLRSLLVPTIVAVTGFKRYVFSSDQFPFTLAHGKLESIRAWLEAKYQELPEGVRREGVCSQ